MTSAWYRSTVFKTSALVLSTIAVLGTAFVLANASTGTASSGPLGPSPETVAPLGVVQAGKPLVMLTMARDHTLFYEAYNDASDIDGDGLLDIRFKPSITYLGLFDSSVCYKYSGGSTATSTDGLFSPSYTADSLGRCSSDTNGGWSGNWLNYVTTSRIDALRKVLYGGHREVDTISQTILRRAYIPQDAHSWAKEYTSETVDGYKITDYTPFSQPSGTGVRRHFFGSLTDTAGVSCSNIDDCSNRPPLLKFLNNSKDTRVWSWASSERAVLTKDHNGTQASNTQYSIRVEVCTATFNNGCKQYPNGSYKPVGLLHDYGENDAMYFGLLTGTYNKSSEGGVLRKVVSSFKEEVNQTTGVFTSNAKIVDTINKLRIRDFNNTTTSNAYRAGWVTNRAMNNGEFPDWGNPVAEMMYESLRYFVGKGAATTAYTGNNARDSGKNIDAELGLSIATWDDPYANTSAAKAQWCSKPNLLVVSGINPSFDSDQVPGAQWNVGTTAFTGDVTGLNVNTIGQTIADVEPGVKGSRFIGQVGTSTDGAPTAKNVTSFGNIRGLAPEEPTKQGSYYSVPISYFAKTNDIRPTLEGKQTLDTFTVALSSPLPKIEVPINGKVITLVPFAKSVTAWKPSFAPTNQIVDFYVARFANTTGPTGPDYDTTVNGGRYFAQFRINFEDVEQGADHDMDAITVYEVALNADNSLRVRLTPEYQAGGARQNMGYIISGSTKDGVYLSVQDENVDNPYYLNVPDGMNPGDCDGTNVNNIPAKCKKLPYINGPTTPDNLQYSERTFTVGATAATYLKEPLWYASKWGGFVDRNANSRPDLQSEWDADNDSVPDTYFLVQNPTKLRTALRKVFNSIYERSAAAGNIAANSTSFTSETAVYQSVFNSGNWSGDLIAYPITRNGINFTPYWKASEKVPAHADRKIFTRYNNAGVAFTTGMDSDAKLVLDSNTSVQDAIIRYVRGDRNTELQNGGSFRNRPTGVLGDIINSSPFYLKESNTVFVGSNAGMLHAFNAKTGVERFAYIPGTALPHLKNLTEPGYSHRFYVDGEIVVSQKSETDNKNLLFGFLGRGGKGFFALDVTNPDTFGTSNVLWEAGGSDVDMGYVLGRPQIAKVRTGVNTQATLVVFGNGYNSTSGKAALFFYKTDGTLYKKLSTGVGTTSNPNGMATPFLLTDDNGFLTMVYGGDLQGNVWKFDVSDMDVSKWTSVVKVGDQAVPLITVQDPDGKVQPITAPITSFVNPLYGDTHFGKRFIFFGTGQYMTPEDVGNKSVQTMYGFIDDGSSIIGRSQLVQRKVTAEGVFNERNVRTFSQAVENDMVDKKGWYMDWLTADNGAIGERVINSAELIFGFKPVLVVSSIIPLEDPCVPGGRGPVNILSPFSGGSVFNNTDTKGFFDVNNNNLFTDDKLNSKFVDSVDLDVGLPGSCVLIGNRLVCGGSKATLGTVKVNAGESNRRRVSWREIVR